MKLIRYVSSMRTKPHAEKRFYIPQEKGAERDHHPHILPVAHRTLRPLRMHPAISRMPRATRTCLEQGSCESCFSDALCLSFSKTGGLAAGHDSHTRRG